MAKTTETLSIGEYGKIILREAYRFRFHVCVLFALISLIVLLLGVFLSKTYSTSATLYADQSNIIQPLLSGQAETTAVEDQVRIVKESINSPRLLNKVVSKTKALQGTESAAEIEKKINALRESIKVYGIGPRHIKVSYDGKQADKVFNTLSAIVEEFIKDSSDAKRSESRLAFEFINNQVESYKDQLQKAETRLREFKSDSRDGSETVVNGRIAALRATIEGLELDIEGLRTRISGIQSELGREKRLVDRSGGDDSLVGALAAAEKEKKELLLSYTATHPDVKSLQFRIDDLKQSIKEQAKNPTQNNAGANLSTRTVYGGLRSELADANVQLRTYEKRLVSSKQLLAEEYERLGRVADNEATLSELTRDYNVTRGFYEDMLKSKEKARLSMALDVQGRGLNYKIQDPPIYPLNPKGLRFYHYLLLGPLLGLLIPIGLLIAYVLLDPRVRSPKQLAGAGDTKVIGVVGHTATDFGSLLKRQDALLLGFILLSVFVIYIAAIIVKLVTA